jgi:hypothetical protein
MKTSLPLKVAVLILALSGIPPCFPQTHNARQRQTAKHFVESVYAGYGRAADPPNLFEENASQAFDPSLIALARADAVAAKPDVGVLDYDPVCNCQDTDDSFPDLNIFIEPIGLNCAKATVTFGGYNHQLNRISLTLVNKNGHWRIFNIQDMSSGSSSHNDLRTLLRKDIKELSSKNHR